jgi:hypothetical protein
MFSKINFNDYTSKRKDFYDTLSKFSVETSKISTPIEINQEFLNKINIHFGDVLKRRLEKNKFSNSENKQYKDLIKAHFPEVKPIFDHKGPTIYWFKINYSDGLTNEDILKNYTSVKKGGTGWWTKAHMARKTSPTDILYLGKIEAQFENRFIQHIGLGHNFTTALKLQRWMPNLKNMSLTFNFLKVDAQMKPYLEDIEKVLWEESKPLLGAEPRF